MILFALAFGVYFMPVSSGLLVIGFTVTVSMLNVDVGEFSNGLLLDRLELTAAHHPSNVLAAAMFGGRRVALSLGASALAGWCLLSDRASVR